MASCLHVCVTRALTQVDGSFCCFSKMKGSDNQEKLVYQIIEDAGNKGDATKPSSCWFLGLLPSSLVFSGRVQARCLCPCPSAL